MTVDSYSETISSNLSSSDSTITVESDSLATSSFEETPCKLNTDTKGIETTLHQIASGLQKCHRRLFDIGFSYIWDSSI